MNRVEQLSKYFEKRMLYWQKALGFMEMQFIVVGNTAEEDYRAHWEMDLAGMQAYVEYSIPWLGEEGRTELEVDRTAFHEVFEIAVFGEIGAVAKQVASCDVVDTMKHRVVRRAENTIFEAMRGRKTNVEG